MRHTCTLIGEVTSEIRSRDARSTLRIPFVPMRSRPTALIAGCDPLMCASLKRMLTRFWAELDVIAQARDGLEAIARFESRKVDVCFLDAQMPELSGIEVAHRIGQLAHVALSVDRRFLEAFADADVEYLARPIEPVRLVETIKRLKERIGKEPAMNIRAAMQQISLRLTRGVPGSTRRWLQVHAESGPRLIPEEAIDYLRSETKYTRIFWHGDRVNAEGLTRTSIKQLLEQLDPSMFVQVHRSVIVNMRSIKHIALGTNDIAGIHLRGRKEVLPVSRSYLPIFRGTWRIP